MRAFLLLLLLSSAALADDAGLLRCRAIQDSAARLACYDALVVPPAGSKPATAPQPAATPQGKARETVEQFGVPQKSREVALDAIDSSIAGRFEGWRAGDRIAFVNGQVWQIADDSRGYHDIMNPKVRVRRGALGAYYLEIEGTNRSPRVIRVK